MKPDRMRIVIGILSLCSLALSLSACQGQQQAEATTHDPPAVAVSTMEVVPQDTPVDFKFIGTVKSSRKVEIRARVEGFLEQQLYREGAMVQQGEPLFQIDRKPFEASLQMAKGELALRQAQFESARDNLARVKPLAQKNAISLKDLDDAVSQQKTTEAALWSAQARVRQAELHLDYTKVAAPVTGVAGKSHVPEGSFIAPGLNGLLTYVAQIDPILVSFNITENELLQVDDLVERGLLFVPENRNFEVEVIRGDGKLYPYKGTISFAEPVLNPQTGTYEVEAKLENPQGKLRPGQFVRIRLKGAYRPQAILVPQSAVTEGGKGSFVWVMDSQKKARARYLELGRWHGDRWFVDDGLKAGEHVILDNISRIAPGMLLNPNPVSPVAKD